ncbi:hypothetical protein CLV57_0910 [Mucilaginibacter auburnensis]|uniref:Uncharacterized protein n=2 Tax=Mucilaginibacter auburnensis TaxID=1457233 RepID=A0A2H9VSX3_9SPHI|nr:hypothetical protein CLV57_0910 [Mucilaginibacter auburnensis]
MQDKEFDQLFNSKLNDFEIEPSPMVWKNIVEELDGKKEPKRSLMPYLSIAASVIILAAASVLFFNRDVKKDDDKPLKLVKETKPVKSSVVNSDSAPVNRAVEDDNSLKQMAVVLTESKPQFIKPKVTKKVNEEVSATDVTEVEKSEPLLAAANVETATSPVLKPVVPTNDIPLSTSLLAVNGVQPISEKHPVVSANAPDSNKPVIKKRARGLGGLINTIVAAVDKREDKLIEFTDADNDEGTKITAVNLGIFKIKKQ